MAAIVDDKVAMMLGVSWYGCPRCGRGRRHQVSRLLPSRCSHRTSRRRSAAYACYV